MRLLCFVVMTLIAITSGFSLSRSAPRARHLLLRQPAALAAGKKAVASVSVRNNKPETSAELSRTEYLYSTMRMLSSIAKRNMPSSSIIAAMHSAVPKRTAPRITTEHGQRVDRRQLRIEESFSDMEIVFLGTASTVPGVHRGVSCTGLRFGSETWLFDVGEGSQIQIQKSVVRPSRVRRIFITHLHGDHVWGLPGMMCLIGKDREGDPQKGQLIEIYGPEGVREFLRTAIEITYSKSTPSFQVHELKAPKKAKSFQRNGAVSRTTRRTYGEIEGTDIYPDENGVYHLFDTGSVAVAAARIKHSIPCFGFVVQEHDRSGTLKAEKVMQLIYQNWDGLQKRYGDAKKANRSIKALKPGEIYTFPDGTQVGYEDVMDAPHRGRKIAILGDTSDPSNITTLAQDADVLVHEATNNFLSGIDEGTSAKTVERDAKRHGHSTAEMAGRFAKKIGARKLLLNHFSPRYLGDGGSESMLVMQRIEKLARRTMGSKPDEDNVIAAWDMLRVPLLINKPPNVST